MCLSNSEACCNNFPDAVRFCQTDRIFCSRSSVYYVKKQPAKALIHSGLLGCEQHLKQSNLPWHHEDGSATSSPNKEWEIDQFKKDIDWKMCITDRQFLVCFFTTLVSWLVSCRTDIQLLPQRLQCLTGYLAWVGLQVRQYKAISIGQHKAVTEN